MITETLVRVRAPHFTAGLILLDDICIQAAPIISWCKGKDAKELRAYFATAGWKATVVNELKTESRVVLTRDGLLGLSADDRADVERVFGVAMIQSIIGGNAEEFEGEWRIHGATEKG